MGCIFTLFICAVFWSILGAIGIVILAASMAFLWILSKIFDEEKAMIIFVILLALCVLGIVIWFWGDWWTMAQYVMLPVGIFLYLYLAFD